MPLPGGNARWLPANGPASPAGLRGSSPRQDTRAAAAALAQCGLRFRRSLERAQRDSQIVMRRRKARPRFDRDPAVPRGALPVALLLKLDGEIVVCQGIAGPKPQGFRDVKVSLELAVGAAIVHHRRQVAVGQRVGLVHCQYVPPERLAVPPIAHLHPGEHRENRQRDRKCGNRGTSQPAFQELGRGEYNRDEDAGRRQVRIAVGHRLVADHDDSADRRDHPQEPEPAHRGAAAPRRASRTAPIEMPASAINRRRKPKRRLLPHGVTCRQIQRNDCFQQVAAVAQSRRLQSKENGACSSIAPRLRWTA